MTQIMGRKYAQCVRE